MPSNRRGFTLIELMIVVVIIGILVAIAIPKFAATKDKAKLVSVRTDLRNMMTAEEAYLFENSIYGDFGALQAASNFILSTGNTMTITPGASGYTATASNASISSAIRTCTVQVGGGASATTDGVIICS